MAKVGRFKTGNDSPSMMLRTDGFSRWIVLDGVGWLHLPILSPAANSRQPSLVFLQNCTSRTDLVYVVLLYRVRFSLYHVVWMRYDYDRFFFLFLLSLD